MKRQRAKRNAAARVAWAAAGLLCLSLGAFAVAWSLNPAYVDAPAQNSAAETLQVNDTSASQELVPEGDTPLEFTAEENAAVMVAPVAQASLETSQIEQVSADPTAPTDPNELVQVVIVLDAPSVLEQGYDARDVLEDTQAQAARQQILNQQQQVLAAIQEATGLELTANVSLSLAANAVSVEVPYGKLETISQIEGVSQVAKEQIYYPCEPVEGEETASDLSTNMYFAGAMSGATTVNAAGYYGAGSRIAIIDTGIDASHQALSTQAWEYALRQNAQERGMTYEEYAESLDLLDENKVAALLPSLNASQYLSDVAADQVVVSGKIAFAFDYADSDTDAGHTDAGNHGSHVAGISAANRYIEQEGQMVSALEATYVQGVAPDAQLLVMKVFGSNGASSSAIAAAMEDAMLLGADSMNLSLGSAGPGSTDDFVFTHVLENIRTTGTVVCISAGNESSWGTYSQVAGQYTTDVSTDAVGSPGSCADALTVASADNAGSIVSGSLNVAGKAVEYRETLKNGDTLFTNAPIAGLDTSSDGTGTSYEYILVDSLCKPGDLDGIDVAGKVVLVKRGDNSFSDKANNAVAAGAQAVIVYNHSAGLVNMSLADYQYDKPVVFISDVSGAYFRSSATEHQAENGKTYYQGTLSVVAGLTVVDKTDELATMSSFSSWGVPGDLTLKPEITAPGGNVYSIAGAEGTSEKHDAYVSYSGTSMAAPNVAGIAALVSERIQEHGYTGNFTSSTRGLVQSLMMSTAKPLKDANGNFYSVLRQGAGLVDAAAACSADSYIRMRQDATASYADGKVKAELGDDPDRTGVYTFSFDLYNLSSASKTFDLSASAFAQDCTEKESKKGSDYTTCYMSESTRALEASAAFTVGGAATSQVTVAAGGKSRVTVTLTLSDADRAFYQQHYPCGGYVQAYVFAAERTSGEGVSGTTHSIPVLAFYGNWTESPMFYYVSTSEGQLATSYRTPSTTDDTRTDYFDWDNEYNDYAQLNYFEVHTDGSGSTTRIGGNPLVSDEIYHPERNAVGNDTNMMNGMVYLSRNASSIKIKVANETSGEAYLTSLSTEGVAGAYKNTSGSNAGIYNAWRYNLDLSQASTGDVITFSMTALPEYYDSGKMGKRQTGSTGAVAAVSATVDTEAPQLWAVSMSSEALLSVSASDENYVSGVVAYTPDGTQIVAIAGSKDQAEPGQTYGYQLDVHAYAGDELLVQVFDYALNASTYRVFLNGPQTSLQGVLVGYDNDCSSLVQMDAASQSLGFLSSDAAFSAATLVGGFIYGVDATGALYALDAAQPEGEIRLVGQTGLTMVDMAYNPVDGLVYGLTDDGRLITLDVSTAQAQEVESAPFATNTLACDAQGVFYSNKLGTNQVYRYQLGQEPSLVATAAYVKSAGAQAMEVDLEQNALYWASYFTDSFASVENAPNVGFSRLYRVDLTTGQAAFLADFDCRLTGLVVVPSSLTSGYNAVTPSAKISDGVTYHPPVTPSGCGASGHQWSDWRVVTPATGGQQGSKTRSCGACGQQQTKVIPSEQTAPTSPVETSFDAFQVQVERVERATLTGAVPLQAQLIQREFTPESEKHLASYHFLVTLGSEAYELDSVHLDFKMGASQGAGYGDCLKKTKVSSVGWDADDASYDVDISSGAGSFTCYYYQDGDKYIDLTFDFIIGDQSKASHQITQVKMESGHMESARLWGVKAIKVFVKDTTESPNYWDNSKADVYLWLDPETTADDATVGLQVNSAGAVLSGPEGWCFNGGYLQLQEGEATATFTVDRGHAPYTYTRTYIVHIKNHFDSTEPLLLGDVDGDGAVTSADAELLGKHLAGWQGLTLNLAAADVHSDGVIDLRDLAVLRRFLAGWEGVVLGAAP